MKMPKAFQRTKTQPVSYPSTVRQQRMSGLTSVAAGKMVPLAAFPLLREDKLNASDLRVSFNLMETADLLQNAVLVNVKAYLVPFLAFKRFSGTDELNRAYTKQPLQEGGPVTPMFATGMAGLEGSNAIHKSMGFHSAQGDMINLSYVEAYNEIWNFRATNRSKSLILRDPYDTSLAPAFWQHEQFKHIVPDFDQDAMDGKVRLTVANGKLPVRNLAFQTAVTAGTASGAAYDSAGNNITGAGTANATMTARVKNRLSGLPENGAIGPDRVPDIYAELQDNGIELNLSNLELARQTQAFAALRREYGGLIDTFAIDLMMQGISIPEQSWRQPILLADKTIPFGMTKRYATNGADLTKSVADGATFVDLMLTTPPVNCGGIVMIVAEITPEQLFERQRDPLLYTLDPLKLPDALEDTIDPQKVDIVYNGEMDASHATPAGVFGFSPTNWKWGHSFTKIGGRFFRPKVNTAFDEDRLRVWAVEAINPALSKDFYLCPTVFQQKPFISLTQDVGEAMWQGQVSINGLTQFGSQLIESNGDYAAVLAEADQTRVKSV